MTSKYIADKEFFCHCGCGTVYRHDSFIRVLDSLFEYLKPPAINVHCITRCAKHNAEISLTNPGVSSLSHHLTGEALDFDSEPGLSVDNLSLLLLQVFNEKIFPAMGIGFYGWGNHVDFKGRRYWGPSLPAYQKYIKI